MEFSMCPLDFCRKCGTIMPLPTANDGSDSVTCFNKNCDYKVLVSAFHGMETVSKVEFVKINALNEQKDEAEIVQGPTIDHVCRVCKHTKAIYQTRQMRSADEGQSVFYLCMKCGNQDREDS